MLEAEGRNKMTGVSFRPFLQSSPHARRKWLAVPNGNFVSWAGHACGACTTSDEGISVQIVSDTVECAIASN